MLRRLARENAEQGKALSILDDVVFKVMLSSDTEDSREALRKLLCACTRREVAKVKVMNNDLTAAHLDAKSIRLDVHVTFNDGESADLEMQVDRSGDDLKTRSALYSAMMLSGQSKKGGSYGQIKRVYQIFFLNCILFPQSSKLPRRYFYQEEEEHDRLTEVTEIIFYELPKLEHKVHDILTGNLNLKTLREEDKWCIYMRYRHEEKAAALIDVLCREEGIMQAERSVVKVSRDYRRFARKMAEMKNSMDRATKLEYMRKEQFELGIQQGIQQGRQEGIQQGVQQGQTETKFEFARKMKARGLPLEVICEDTGLSLDSIKKL